MGELTNDMTTTEMTSEHNTRILAFHGFENQKIAAIGQVAVDLGCIKGVTTVETVEEPTLVDIEEVPEETFEEPDQVINLTPVNKSNKETVQEDEHAWIYILVGVVLGIGLMALFITLFVMYKQRKGCFKKTGLPTNQTMPISLSGSMKSG